MLVSGAGESDAGLLNLGGGDGGGYYALARSIQDGNGLSDPLFMLRPPGLPLIEAALFGVTTVESPWLVMSVNLVASTATVMVTVLLAESLGLRRRYALVAGLIVTIDPASVYYGITPLTEPVFTLLLTTLAFVIVKYSEQESGKTRSVIAISSAIGLLLAGTMLLKPVALAFVVLVVVAMVARHGRRAYVYSPVLLIPVVVWVAWSASNQSQFDNFSYSNSLSYNLLLIKTPTIIHAADGEDEEQIRRELIYELGERRGVEYGPDVVHYDFTTEADSATLSEMNALALDKWLDYPSAHFRATATATYSVLVNFRGDRFLSILMSPLRMLLYALAAAGVFIMWRNSRRIAATLTAAIITYFILANIFFLGVGDLRLAAPVYPLLAVLAMVALQNYLTTRRSGQPRSPDSTD